MFCNTAHNWCANLPPQAILDSLLNFYYINFSTGLYIITMSGLLSHLLSVLPSTHLLSIVLPSTHHLLFPVISCPSFFPQYTISSSQSALVHPASFNTSSLLPSISCPSFFPQHIISSQSSLVQPSSFNVSLVHPSSLNSLFQIGRASCRERV